MIKIINTIGDWNLTEFGVGSTLLFIIPIHRIINSLIRIFILIFIVRKAKVDLRGKQSSKKADGTGFSCAASQWAKPPI